MQENKDVSLISRNANRFYVYTLAYPDGTVFYVGKGQGNRMNSHEWEARSGRESSKCQVIRQIWTDGGQVLKTKIQEGMNEADAYHLEIELIRMYRGEHLTNLTDGGEGKGAPVRFGPRVDMHVKIPMEDMAALEAATTNKNEWILSAIREKLEREMTKEEPSR